MLSCCGICDVPHGADKRHQATHMGEQHAGSTEGVAVHCVRACGHDYKQCGTGQAAAAGMGPTRQTWMVSVPFSESVLISTYEWRTACTYAADRPPCTLFVTQAAVPSA